MHKIAANNDYLQHIVLKLTTLKFNEDISNKKVDLLCLGHTITI